MIKTIIKIEGMKCTMCVKHVEEALKKGFKTKKIVVSLESNEAIILSKEKLENELIKSKIELLGFNVLDIIVE